MVAAPDESPNLSLSADDISETCSAPGMDAAAAAPNFRFSAADIGPPLPPPEDAAPNFKLSAADIDVEGCAPGILAALAAPNFKLSAAEISDDVALYAPGLWALAAAAAAAIGGDFFFPLVEVAGSGPLPNFTRSASEISSFDTATAPTNASGGDFSFDALALPSIPS